jgi:hypothetical protein
MTVEKSNSIIELLKLDYGSVVSENTLVELCEIQIPDLSGNSYHIIKNAKKYELDKMSAYLSINEQLLGLGKCLVQDKDIYRVPLISEMFSHINKYYNSSNRKFKRAEKLRKSFSSVNPIEATEVNNRVNRTNSMRNSNSKMYTPMCSN